MNNAQAKFPIAEPAADVTITAPPVRKRPHPGERHVQILQTSAGILEHPRGEEITVAGLTIRLNVPEAVLCRHFASKAQMFEGLIEFIEQTALGLINQTTLRGEHGLHQVHTTAYVLLSSADKNPGITRVPVGDVLVDGDECPPERMAQCLDRIEASLEQSLCTAVTQGAQPTDTDIASRTNLLVCMVLGRWYRYAKSGFWKSPVEGANAQLRVLLA